MTAERYPEELWIHADTDGSAGDTVTNGGAGVYVKFPEGEIQPASIPAGKYRSNYMAEIKALMQAVSVVRDSSNECEQVAFLSNALSVLEATAGVKLPRLAESLHEVAQHRRVVLQWVPAHCGLPANEKQTSSPNLEPKEDSKTTVSPSRKRIPTSEKPWGNALRGMTSTSLTGCRRSWS